MNKFINSSKFGDELLFISNLGIRPLLAAADIASGENTWRRPVRYAFDDNLESVWESES